MATEGITVYSLLGVYLGFHGAPFSLVKIYGIFVTATVKLLTFEWQLCSIQVFHPGGGGGWGARHRPWSRRPKPPLTSGHH